MIDAVDIQLISPYHPTLALNRGGFPEGFSCHHLKPDSVRCPRGFAPRHQRNGQHACVGSGKEHTGYYNYLNTLKLCDIVSQFNDKLTSALNRPPPEPQSFQASGAAFCSAFQLIYLER